MASVVIIHAAEDALPARALGEKLRSANIQAIFEAPPGEDLHSAIAAAPAVIALWSPRSISSPGLAEDVRHAQGQTLVVHACMQSVRTPEQFHGDQSVNLTGWRGEDDFPGWRQLGEIISQAVNGAPLPTPAPRPDSGFFQPGRPASAPAPKRREPSARPADTGPSQPSYAPPEHAPPEYAPPEPARARGGAMIALLVLAAAAIGGGGYYFWSQSQGGQGGAAAWENLDQTDPGALRAFLAGDPGPHRAEAQAALEMLDERSFEAASDADTIEALQAFVTDFPDSEHALAARGRIAELQTMPRTNPDAALEESLPPLEQAPDPDLVPPTATQAPVPLSPGPGPTALTPPPPVEEIPGVEPGAPEQPGAPPQ